MREVLGMDYWKYYKSNDGQNSRINCELSSEEKLKNILFAKDLVHRNKMVFSSGDNEFHHLSDVKCCCVEPQNAKFSNYYKGHLGISIYNSVREGKINFDNVINEWHPKGGMREYLNSHCRIKGINSVKKSLIYKINNPFTSNSPSSFFGIDADIDNNYTLKRKEIWDSLLG